MRLKTPSALAFSHRLNEGRKHDIDIAKMIAIFAVMLDHSQYYVGPVYASQYFMVFRILLFGFYLQIFFVTVGLVDREDYLTGTQSWKQFLQKLFTSLLVPYLVWSLILGTRTDIGFIKGLLWGTQTSLSTAGTDSILWFLPVLFFSRIIYRAVMKLMFRFVHKQSVPFLLAAALILAASGSFLADGGKNTVIWGLDIALVCASLILIGRLLTPTLEWLRRQKWQKKLLLLAGLGVLTIITSFLNMPFDVNDTGLVIYRFSVWMAHSCFGANWFLFLVNSAISCLAVLTASMLLEKCTFLAYWGQYTLGFMLIHIKMYPLVANVLLLIPGFSSISSIPMAVIVTAAVTVSCIPVIAFIDHFIPELLGKKRLS